MSKPATQRKRISPEAVTPRMPIWNHEEHATVEVSTCSLLQIPLGAIHLNQAWRIVEYRSGSDELSVPKTALGKHLFSVVPWIRNRNFLATLKSAMRSGISNSHFDFTVCANTAERTIHVNIFALGDMTTWLFISDSSLPPF